MAEPDFNQILDDPALLVQYKDLVIDTYNQLKEEKIESVYQAMLVLHRQNSEKVINTITVFVNRWIELAQLLGQQQDADNLRVSTDVFVGAIQLAADTTYNINITNVKESTNELAAVLSRLFQEAQSQPDIVNSRVQDINAANDDWINASATYVGYWNTQFKDVSDKWQVTKMIRDAVIRASAGTFQNLVKQRESLQDEISNFRQQYTALLKEWSQGLSADRKISISPELLNTRNTIKSKEAELANVKAELNSSQDAIKELLRIFGIEEAS
jgi:hypothetical protein